MSEQLKNRKPLQIITSCEAEITRFYAPLRDKIQGVGEKEDLEEFVNLYSNHISNFRIRCAPKQRAFFHQHERQYSMSKGSPGYETVEQIKKKIEDDVREFAKTAKEAIERDYVRATENIKNRPTEKEDSDLDSLPIRDGDS